MWKKHSIFCSLQVKKSSDIKKLYINNFELQKVNVVKFLGVLIDSKLSWSDHIKSVRSKLCKGIGILIKGRKVLKFSTLLTLYYSFLYPYLTYCIEVWGKANDVHMKQLIKTQKRIVRIITSSSYKTPTVPIMEKLNLFNINQIHYFQVSMFMLRFKRNLLPTVFNDMFKTNSSLHHYSTRNSNKLHADCHNTELFKKGVRFTGRKIWNSVCNILNVNKSIVSNKKVLKKYILTMLKY